MHVRLCVCVCVCSHTKILLTSLVNVLITGTHGSSSVALQQIKPHRLSGFAVIETSLRKVFRKLQVV